MLKSAMTGLALLALLPSVAQAGCLTGAAVGGLAGHMAGHHGLAGAAVGCAIGHHHAAKQRQAAQDRDNNQNATH